MSFLKVVSKNNDPHSRFLHSVKYYEISVESKDRVPTKLQSMTLILTTHAKVNRKHVINMKTAGSTIIFAGRNNAGGKVFRRPLERYSYIPLIRNQ